ncbi:hypothetical protein GCM10009583_20520 [Ornithinicoccus hortensis]
MVWTDHRVAAPLIAVASLVLGTVLLALAVRSEPGDPIFFLWTLAVAVVWVGGAVLIGAPVPAGRGRPVPAFLLGLALVGLFLVGAVLVARIPVMAGPVERLLDHTTSGPLLVVWLVTAVTGACEEVFFRGALHTIVPTRYAVPVTAAAYTLTTLGAGVVLLALAAAVLGVVTGLQRRSTGGVLEPVVTHLTWSTGILFLLPPVLEALR